MPYQAFSEQANRSPAEYACPASSGWSQARQGKAGHASPSGFANQEEADSGGTGRVRSLRSFKEAALIALLVHPHAKHNAHPGIGQRPNRHRMALALGAFVV